MHAKNKIGITGIAEFFAAPYNIGHAVALVKAVIAYKIRFAFYKRGIGCKYNGAMLQEVGARLCGLVAF